MRMLIVENDAIVTKVWKRFFEREFEVLTAYQAPEALEVLKKEGCPDIILLDLRLNGPKSTGMIVYDYIRNELKQSIPILFVTGLESGINLHMQAAAATQFDVGRGIATKIIKKPVRIKELFKAVYSSLEVKASSFLSNNEVG